LKSTIQVIEIITATEMSARIQAAGMNGMPNLNAKEQGEIFLFSEFLLQHVRRNQIKSVQRMLLWSEWVRFHLKKTNTFPSQIGEKEFDDIMTGKLKINVVSKNFFGPIYDGIQYIPREYA
jgi:hypothetical protein